MGKWNGEVSGVPERTYARSTHAGRERVEGAGAVRGDVTCPTGPGCCRPGEAGLWAVGLNGWRWYENGAQRGPDVSTVARSRRVASPR